MTAHIERAALVKLNRPKMPRVSSPNPKQVSTAIVSLCFGMHKHQNAQFLEHNFEGNYPFSFVILPQMTNLS